MRRTLIVSFVAAAALSVTAASATAVPTKATNYDAIPATCEGLGEIVIEVTNIGHWGTGKVQGTTLTLIPRSFTFTGTNLATNEVVFEESFEQRNHAVDDTCTSPPTRAARTSPGRATAGTGAGAVRQGAAPPP
jgi:hypothetical protein